MGKGEKQEEVAGRMEELHKQYVDTRDTVSRFRMGYTNITHEYKIRDELKPHCKECDQEVTVEHLIRQCAAYNSQIRRNSITKDSMGKNKEE
jgi:hypothetical protein